MTRLREICVDVSVLLWLDKFLEAKEVCELRNPQLFLFLYTTFFFGFKPKFRFKQKSFRFEPKFRFKQKPFSFKQKCCASLACSSLFPLLAAHCFTCLQLTVSLACSSLLHLLAPHCFPCLRPTASLSSQKFFLSKLSMLFCRNLNIKTYFCMRKDQLMSPERTSLAP